jgi:CheY-like chemotaxis protein
MENKMILLVEDSPGDIKLTKRALKNANILNELEIVHDGVEALEFLFGEGNYAGRDVSIMPEVILLDLNMPRMNGLETLERIRADDRTKLLPVVVLTTSKEEQDIISSYSLGVNSYIVKPVDFDQFYEAIKQLGLYWLVLNQGPLSR